MAWKYHGVVDINNLSLKNQAKVTGALAALEDLGILKKIEFTMTIEKDNTDNVVSMVKPEKEKPIILDTAEKKILHAIQKMKACNFDQIMQETKVVKNSLSPVLSKMVKAGKLTKVSPNDGRKKFSREEISYTIAG